MIPFLLAGAAGGVLRGAVGLSKYMRSYKDVEVRPRYFLGMVCVSGGMGAAASWITHDMGIAFLGVETLSPALGVIIGYAGGDFLENIFKILVKRTDFFTINNHGT